MQEISDYNPARHNVGRSDGIEEILKVVIYREELLRLEGFVAVTERDSEVADCAGTYIGLSVSIEVGNHDWAIYDRGR